MWYTIETRRGDLMEFAFQKTFSAAEVKIIRKKLKLKTERTGRINECIRKNSGTMGTARW